ncbi:aldo/keto reductase [Dendrosporobacter sp. 1207_IL3150]|uniref:aldo/keto reductase n=1 Tax=Dendrosporobacter sp. 1207_IL3150 TaxID=3084054 RepID=UPI002FD90E72
MGKSQLKVSKLCFGALTIGCLQANLPLQDGAAVIEEALDAGVNFIDTAELYQTYGYIKEAIKHRKNEVIVSSKSYAYTYEDMKNSVENACKQIDRDYIDIFMLHEQTSRLTLKGHWEALEYLFEAKEKGMIRAIGVSTHTIEVVRVVSLIDEIDVIHPILNMRGIGICDGAVEQMLEAINFAASMDKGIYTMKALGGGHLSSVSLEAFNWVLNQTGIASVAVGMQTREEAKLNCKIFSGLEYSEDLLQKVAQKKRKLLIEDWCLGCGQCAQKCPMGALGIENGKAVQINEKCALCGYCGAYCPEFCIKII